MGDNKVKFQCANHNRAHWSRGKSASSDILNVLLEREES